MQPITETQILELRRLAGISGSRVTCQTLDAFLQGKNPFEDRGDVLQLGPIKTLLLTKEPGLYGDALLAKARRIAEENNFVLLGEKGWAFYKDHQHLLPPKNTGINRIDFLEAQFTNEEYHGTARLSRKIWRSGTKKWAMNDIRFFDRVPKSNIYFAVMTKS